MRLFCFCIHDPKPYNSSRYYAYIAEKSAMVMQYTQKGLEEFCVVDFKKDLDELAINAIIHQTTKEFHLMEFRKNLAE